jgi:hypothetical protein
MADRSTSEAKRTRAVSGPSLAVDLGRFRKSFEEVSAQSNMKLQISRRLAALDTTSSPF